MSDAFINGLTVKIGDGGGTEVFTAMSELLSLSGLGVSNTKVDASSFDSTLREYIYGLSEGKEIGMEFNYLPGDTEQAGLIDDVANKTSRNFQIVLTDGTTTKTYALTTLPMDYEINPAFEDKNTITFSLQINSAITVS